MQHEISILIVADDHPIVRQGLRLAIEADPQLKVVAEASDGRIGPRAHRTLHPQVAVLDIEMPDIDGFAVAREIRDAAAARSRSSSSPSIATEGFFTEALRLGAKGYVLKDSAVTDIVSGIRAVAAGEHYTSPALTSYLVRRQSPGRAARRTPGLDDLTPAERRVLELIAGLQDQPRDRRSAARQLPHGAGASHQHLREARSAREPRADEIRPRSPDAPLRQRYDRLAKAAQGRTGNAHSARCPLSRDACTVATAEGGTFRSRSGWSFSSSMTTPRYGG